MILNPLNIIPITKARSQLGNLAKKVEKENYIILTKDGSPKVALVDLTYLTNLENQVIRAYGKTFIDPELLKYAREFTNAEIKEWEKEDAL